MSRANVWFLIAVIAAIGSIAAFVGGQTVMGGFFAALAGLWIILGVRESGKSTV